MSVVKVIVAAVVVAVGGVLVLAMQKPDEFRVSRSITLNAPVEAVFAQVNDLEKGQQWSPWVEMDPEADYQFEGPVAGEGATLHWEGDESGKGTMTIVESVENELVRSRLDFQKPMESTSTVEFALEAKGDATEVTWSMYGPNTFMGKVVSVFMNCEDMVGGQFEKGLSNLKTVVEKP